MTGVRIQTWNNVGRDQEGDPGNDDKQPRGQVVGDDVMGHVSGEDHLEPGQAKSHRHACLGAGFLNRVQKSR